MLENKKGFTTITYKVRLYDRHHEWLLYSRQIYNRVVWHYYQILINELSLLEQSNFLLLRSLEAASIGTKEMKAKGEEPTWKLEQVPKIPLYFRRAAINTAIGLARGYWSSCANGNRGFPTPAKAINCSPVFYKGMYREFQKNTVQLKVYNGKKWVWMTFPYVGREIPKEGNILSPTLKIEKKVAYLHIPVEIPVEDISTVKERMKKETYICAVAFPDGDCLAVCVKMRKDGSVKDSYFIHGGRIREEQRKKVLKRLEKSRKSRKNYRATEIIEGKERENATLYKKLEQINWYYAHKVSCEILDYCRKSQIKVIVVPNYENTIPFEKYQYLNTNRFHWQGRAIIRNLKYKAFKNGILVTTIRPYHISDCCSECGKKIQRYNEGHSASRNYYGGQLFFCSNGHKGNASWNTAKNIGRYFLRQFQKE